MFKINNVGNALERSACMILAKDKLGLSPGTMNEFYILENYGKLDGEFAKNCQGLFPSK